MSRSKLVLASVAVMGLGGSLIGCQSGPIEPAPVYSRQTVYEGKEASQGTAESNRMTRSGSRVESTYSSPTAAAFVRPVSIVSPPVANGVATSAAPARDVKVIRFGWQWAGAAHPVPGRVVAVRIDGGKPMAFLLDPQERYTSLLLPDSMFDLASVRERLRDAQRVTVSNVAGIAGRRTVYRVPVARISLSTATRNDQSSYLLIPAPGMGDQLGHSDFGPILGVLGSDYLSRFDVVFDDPKRRMMLRERPDGDRLDKSLTASISSKD